MLLDSKSHVFMASPWLVTQIKGVASESYIGYLNENIPYLIEAPTSSVYIPYSVKKNKHLPNHSPLKSGMCQVMSNFPMIYTSLDIHFY